MRLCDHDSNMTYYNHGNIRYVKTERLKEEKHHAYRNLWQWKYDFEEYFGESADNLDEIIVVLDPARYGGRHIEYSDEVRKIDILQGASCPVWKMHHHLAHAMSGWMFGESDYQFILDGAGDNYYTDETRSIAFAETVSLYKNYEEIRKHRDSLILDDGNLVAQSHKIIEKFYSIGNFYHHMCLKLSVEGGYIDSPGKLMSLQSFGNFESGFAENYLNKFDIFSDIKEMEKFFDFKAWVEYWNSETVANMKLLDWANTVHQSVAPQIIALFKQYCNKEDRIFYSGGVAQNIVWNTELKKEFPNLIIPPHCGDDGLSLGAIEWLRRKNNLPQLQKDNYPYWQEDEAPDSVPSEDDIKFVATLLAEGKIVGWYQGNGEVGPRALGNRSILMHPMLEDGKNQINSKVKFREGYRPFGASVLKDYQDDFFDLDFDNPHMLYLSKLKLDCPAINHIDNTCRHQTVDDNNPLYKKLIEEFYKLTGYPFLLNTSLNIGGKPIAGNKIAALTVLHGTKMDALVYGKDIYVKESE